jgi:hypothetical protein
MDRLLVEGCKFRSGLWRVEVLHASPPDGFLTDFLRIFTEGRINLEVLIGSQAEDRLKLSCLVAAEEGSRVSDLIHADPSLSTRTTFRAPVALLSIFPHKADLRAVGLGLLALAQKGISLYGFCSSLSTLTFITDFTQAETGLDALGACFDLPESAGTYEG